MPAGRPTDYSEHKLTEAEHYIKVLCQDETINGKLSVKIPTIEGLAYWLGISRSTLYLWQKEYPEFSDIIEQLQVKQAEALIQNGLAGNYNSTIAKVLLTKHGYTDKQEIDQKNQHSGEIIISWKEPDLRDPKDQSGDGELPSIQPGLPDNS